MKDLTGGAGEARGGAAIMPTLHNTPLLLAKTGIGEGGEAINPTFIYTCVCGRVVYLPTPLKLYKIATLLTLLVISAFYCCLKYRVGKNAAPTLACTAYPEL